MNAEYRSGKIGEAIIEGFKAGLAEPSPILVEKFRNIFKEVSEMKINFDAATKDFIRDVKRHLETSDFSPVLLKAIYDAIDSHEPKIRDTVGYFFSLAGIKDGMTVTLPLGDKESNHEANT